MKNQSKLINFLLDCKQSCDKSEFNSQVLCAKHNVGKQLPAVMKKLNIIGGHGEKTQWTYSGEIGYYLAKKLREGVRDYNNHHTIKKPITASLFAVSHSKPTTELNEANAVKLLKSLGYKILKPSFTEL